MAEIREHEELFNKDITDICVAFFDKFSKGDVDSSLEIPEDLHIVNKKIMLYSRATNFVLLFYNIA